MDSTAGIGVLGRGATGLEGQAEKTPQEVPTTRREEDALSAGWGGKAVWRWPAVVSRAEGGRERSEQSRQPVGRTTDA